MKLTEQQAMILVQTLQDTLAFVNGSWTHDRNTREALWLTIMNNQLGTTLVDLEKENNNED